MGHRKFEVVGKSLTRKDGLAKVSGREIYTSDVILPDMMYAAVLRSPYPHAEIRSIDVSAAEAMGAVCLTFDDVPMLTYNERTVSIPEKTYRDRTVLPKRVRHVGEAVAAAAAETEEEAFEALQRIRVEYEELPAVYDPVAAMRPDSVDLYKTVFLGDEEIEIFGNVACTRDIARGDVDKGFAEADVTVERDFSLQRVYHFQMETKSAVCSPEPDGGITVWTTTQTIHNVRQLLGWLFGIPLHKVNVKRIAIGGSFGSSIQMNSITPICVGLALKARRPVKLVSSREDDLYDHAKYPARIRLKLGAQKDGRLVAGHMKVIIDIGAHNVQAYPLLGCMAGWFASLYKYTNLKFEGKAVYTNKVPSCAMQGYGNPQVNFAVECLMDELAEKLHLDPIELRLRNYVGVGDEFWGQGPTVRSIIRSCGVEEMLSRGAEIFEWGKRPEANSRDTYIKRGVGVARGFHTSGTGGPEPGEVIDYSGATVKINEDGSVDLLTPLMDHGGGTWDAAAKIVAEVLKVPYDMVGISPADTRSTLYDVCTHATRGVYCGGGAIYHVAQQVKQKLLEVAARIFEEAPENLTLERNDELGQGVIYPTGLPQKYLTIGEVAKTAQIKSWGTIASTDSYRQKNCPPCFVTHFVEVEINIKTGHIDVVRAALLGDCGTPINPDLIEGQLIGGLSRGLGYALLEETAYDSDTGMLKCDGFITDYKVPTACEMPKMGNIKVYLADTFEPTGPLGAKGIGEAALNSVAAAIANAIYDAIGVRFMELPITPEKVLEALSEKGVGAR
ncbi:MAG: molybdopterin-dependent oxidoreductase [Chloroflexi bacterium]|nr:molybdopterin-dependent oxidoreductase [Chloroflexota bacterium]